MQAFTTLDGLVMPLDRAHVDTDALIPKQFIKSIERTGFGPHLFDEWRYLDPGELGQDPASRVPNPDFPMQQPRYAGASILVARDNFGCGSSREHAVWALEQAGFRALIAPSFADIFFDNCCKNGVLPIVLSSEQVQALLQKVHDNIGFRLHVDLAAQRLTLPDGQTLAFALDAHRRHALLEGLDPIGITLAHADRIRAFEQQHRAAAPWMFDH